MAAQQTIAALFDKEPLMAPLTTPKSVIDKAKLLK
jgi:hypothetical protein